MLGMAHFEPEQLGSVSEVVIDKDSDGFAITSVHLSVVAKIPDIDEVTFQSSR
jgi:osmotically inducible protein OsmC